MNNREKVIKKIENYMNLLKISKQQLAEKWGKSYAYVCRRFSEEVDFSLTDIKEIIDILEISQQEAIDIFFK